MRIFTFFLLLFGFMPLLLPAQAGCTDPQALNYNAGAMLNDGSCTYPETFYNLNTKTELNSAVLETSGLVMADGALWTHNDGGHAPALYRIDTVSNQILQVVEIGGATNVDWEDLAFDGVYFYIGDFGNNANGNRTDLVIYKVPLAAIPAGSSATVPATAVEEIRFQYADQVDFSPQGPNHTAFDCEAMVWRGDSLHLFTKNWIEPITVHYTLPAEVGTYQASRRETLATDGVITGADISGPGVLALCGYRTDNALLFMWLLFDYSGGYFFNGNKRRIGTGLAIFSGQTEAICFRESGYGYISNEALNAVVLGVPVSVPARLYSFQVAQWLQPVFLPVKMPAGSQFVRCNIGPSPFPSARQMLANELLPEDARAELWDLRGRAVWQGAALELSAVGLQTPGVYSLRVFTPYAGLYCAEKIIVH
ncbi:MAG: hypothetical protein IPM81_12755 [Saprospirales bacterium]|nr:hypothetical protein [Saprospirales bacterium]